MHSKETSVLIELPRKKPTNNWYQLKEIETNKTWVPTLYVSKLEWPEKLTQSELTRFPSINAIYKSVAKEIPIVDGLAYITKRNSKKRPKGYKISGNNFSPNLIRALHKAEKNSILLFKDITLFIPGKGRINIGDKIIDIDFGKK
jgi:acyl-CoA synthetase (AMP-forming)/AMP-acid ligase II